MVCLNNLSVVLTSIGIGIGLSAFALLSRLLVSTPDPKFPLYNKFSPCVTPDRGSAGSGAGTPNSRGGRSRGGGRGFDRGRGRGRGKSGTPINSNSGTQTPVRNDVLPSTNSAPLGWAAPSDYHFGQRGQSGKRRVSRGIGAAAGSFSSAPLSQLLVRPLLRPIAFVKASLQPVLFQRTEEILEGVQAEEGEFQYADVVMTHHHRSCRPRRPCSYLRPCR